MTTSPLALHRSWQGPLLIVAGISLLAACIAWVPEVRLAVQRNLAFVAAIRTLASNGPADTDSLVPLAAIHHAHPDDEASLALVRVLVQQRDLGRAEQVALDALAVSSNPSMWDALGDVEAMQGKLDQAFQAWEQAGNFDKAIGGRWNRAVSFWAERPAEARADFLAVARLGEMASNPYWQAEGLRMTCATYRLEQNWADALAACERAVELQPGLHTALAELGQVLDQGFGQKEAAAAYLRAALERDPSNTYYAALLAHATSATR